MDEPKKRVIDVTTPGKPSTTSRPVIPSSQPLVADPTLAPAPAAPKKITIADQPAEPVLPSMTGPTVVTPSLPPAVEASLPSQPEPAEPPVQPVPPPADDMQNIPRFGELQPKIDSHPLFSGAPDSAPKKPRRWLRRLAWILSALLILLIAAYLLIDSGVVRDASHLPFHIFKQPVAATTTPSITPLATNPYADWKTYTLTNEKLSFKYPNTWTLKDDNASQAKPPTDSDAIELNAPDGFAISIGARAAGGYGGDDSTILSADPITFIGQADYLQYRSNPINATTASGNVDLAWLSTTTDQKYKFPPANNNITNSNSLSKVTEFNINMSFPAGKSPKSAKGNADIDAAKLIIGSASY